MREDVEDQLGSIENFPREEIFQIASLRRRKFVVENDRGHLSILQRIFDRFGFAFADVIRRGRLLQFLRDGIDYFRAGRIRQFRQFRERILQVPLRDALFFQADQQGALVCFFRTRFNHSLTQLRDLLRVAKSRSQLPCD